MSGVSHPEPAGPDGSWLWLAGAAAAGALLLAGFWLARLVTPGQADGLSPDVSWLPPLGVAALLACAWGLARRGWQARHWAAQRAAQRRLVDLLDCWLWQSDAQHRLVSLRPPADAPAPAWQLAQGLLQQRPALWSALAGADRASELQARLVAGASQLDLPVEGPQAQGQPAAAGAAAEPWRLRGVPCFDARGRFTGYEGLLQPPAARVGAVPSVEAAARAAADGSQAGDAAQAARAAGAGRAPVPEVDPTRADQEAFAYAVSHDLRAPLRVVEGFGRILKEDYGAVLGRIGNDHLDRVMGAAARMNGMIDALLEQARLSTQPMARQPVNLSQLAALVMDDLRRTSPEREAEVRIDDGLCAQGDPLLLRLVLENLLGNAWKYSGGRERACIEFRCEERATPDGRMQRVFCICDNGVGFDMRYAQRLFGMFQRLHSATQYPGTGVGLASVRRIVHRHGGEIWAESEVDRGTRFYFTLEGGPARG